MGMKRSVITFCLLLVAIGMPPTQGADATPPAAEPREKTPDTADLILRAEHACQISLDGGKTYSLPEGRQLKWPGLKPGKHRLRITVPGKKARTSEFVLKPGRTQTLVLKAPAEQHHPAPRSPRRLNEDFASNRAGWPEGEMAGGRATIIRDHYLLEADGSGPLLATRPVSLQPAQDFRIEVTATKAGGVDDQIYGLAWGAKDATACHYFGVTGDGRYVAGSFVDGENTPAVQLSRSGLVNKGNGTNILGVWKRNENVHLIVNGRRVDTVKFKPLPGNGIGPVILSGGAALSVEFDNIKVTQTARAR